MVKPTITCLLSEVLPENIEIIFVKFPKYPLLEILPKLSSHICSCYSHFVNLNVLHWSFSLCDSYQIKKVETVKVGMMNLTLDEEQQWQEK